MLAEAPEFISKILRDITGIFVTIATFLGSSNPASFTIAGFVKMLPYLRYMEITYPPRLEATLDNLNASLVSFAFGPKLPSSVTDLFSNDELPGKFGKYHLHSSFLLNYWQTMTSLAIIFIAACTFWALYRLTKKCGPLNCVIEKIKLILKWNFFLIIFCTNLDGVALYTSLEMRSLHLDSIGSIISFVLCVLVNLLVITIFCLIILIVIDFRKRKNQIHPGTSTASAPKWDDFQLLYKGSKDDSVIRHIFMFPFLARIYIFNLVIAYLFEYPMLQAIIILSMNVIMILYMIIIKPFVSKVVHYQHVSDEIFILTVNISLLILAILDYNGSDDNGTRVTLGDIIIIINMILSFSSLFFLALYIIVGLKTAYDTIKVHKVQGVLSVILVFLAPFEAGGMDMELVPTSPAELQSPRSEEGKNNEVLMSEENELVENVESETNRSDIMSPPVSTPKESETEIVESETNQSDITSPQVSTPKESETETETESEVLNVVHLEEPEIDYTTMLRRRSRNLGRISHLQVNPSPGL